ncbi:hypothetical protein [Clostridium neonatale]|jgi:MFS-type transporter involved in bile tolerance (Atg22 family)|uniref:hypothetical protein n=1 Tax=Clostridium neonatale TaxID=137838 RepID=UPI00291B9D31|nr:hypothetical protein [Clostridium neonatale]CAI3207759.1 hypothetical protein CNEO2_360042 [Clostridium neonatale]
MNSLTVWIITMLSALLGIFLGLLISKINSKLSWKQVLSIKYKVMIVAPLINIISNRIIKKKKSLGILYKIRNKLMDKLTQC